MKARAILLLQLAVCVVGCASPRSKDTASVPSEPVEMRKGHPPEPVAPPGHRRLTEKQEELLRTFALKESPELWQTVQALRGEIVNRKKAMEQLAADLTEFGRNPNDDVTYRELQLGREQIACTLDNVYKKLENAYIAYKKFQATPGKVEYGEIMRRALEDGSQEAELTCRKYLDLSIIK